MTDEARPLSEDWPQRAWGLAALGALIGLTLYLLIDKASYQDSLSVWRYASSGALLTFGVTLAFVVDRKRGLPSALFAASAALLVGLVIQWSGGPEAMEGWEAWRMFCAVVTIVIAAPLFQGWMAQGFPRPFRPDRLSYPQVHDRAWVNILLWAACWLFVGIVMLLGFLLGELFRLIGIQFVHRLMSETAFTMPLAGASFGAAAAILRDREAILGTLQTVVRKVLSVLAPVLGVALVLFVLSLPFTGLQPLWDATKATTPILLTTMIAAVILANAAIGDTPEDEARLSIVRWGVMALGAALLPLGIIAAISTGLRVSQYGLTPDRLWAIVFVGVGCAFAFVYATMLVRGRAGWQPLVRRANIWLASGLCLLALLLSTPLLSFNAISVRSQLARLESGSVSPDKFSWSALRFGFGTPGRDALKNLAKAGKTPDIRKRAAEALAVQDADRWSYRNDEAQFGNRITLAETITILPKRVPLPDGLFQRIDQYGLCHDAKECTVLYTPGALEAVAMWKSCDTCTVETRALFTNKADWSDQLIAEPDGKPRLPMPPITGANPSNPKMEVRTITRRQVFVDGQPIGDVLQLEPEADPNTTPTPPQIKE